MYQGFLSFIKNRKVSLNTYIEPRKPDVMKTLNLLFLTGILLSFGCSEQAV